MKIADETSTSAFDVADYLKNEDDAQGFLNEVIREADGDARVIAAALGAIARARGVMADIAEKTNLSRESLYKALSGRRDPSFSTILKVVKALGITFDLNIHQIEKRPQIVKIRKANKVFINETRRTVNRGTALWPFPEDAYFSTTFRSSPLIGRINRHQVNLIQIIEGSVTAIPDEVLMASADRTLRYSFNDERSPDPEPSTTAPPALNLVNTDPPLYLS